MSRPRWPSSTPTCARRECTSWWTDGCRGTRPIAWTARRPTCWGRAGRREKEAAGRSTSGCRLRRLPWFPGARTITRLELPTIATERPGMSERVLLADDHAVVRQGLRALLEKRGLEVVGEAADGPAAPGRPTPRPPDRVVPHNLVAPPQRVDAAPHR